MLLLTFIEKLKDMKAQAAQLPANEATIGAEQQRLHDLQEKNGDDPIE